MKIKLVILFIIIINLKKEINSQLNGIRGNGAPGGDGGTGIIGTPGGGNGQQGLGGGNGGNVVSSRQFSGMKSLQQF